MLCHQMHQRQESGVAAPLKMPSFRFLEHPHALAHQRGPRHHLAAHLAVSHIDLHLLHPPNSLPIPSGYSAVIDAYRCDLMNPADVCAIFEKYGKGDLGCRSHSGAFPSCSLPQPRTLSTLRRPWPSRGQPPLLHHHHFDGCGYGVVKPNPAKPYCQCTTPYLYCLP